MKLADLQRRFVASLYGEPAGIEAAIRGAGGIDARGRIAIYRHNLEAGFAKALALEFPVIAALCGAEYFALLAREFQRAHPSTSGDLHDIGGPFPRYLRQRFGAGDHAYFADVAALEWAREAAARAADDPPLDPAALQLLAGADAPALRFAVHASVHLVASCWPVLSVWEAHQGPGDVRSVDLGAGAEYVLVRRGAAGVALERTGSGEHHLLAALQRGATLGAAYDAALVVDPHFDVAACLRRVLARGVFMGVVRP